MSQLPKSIQNKKGWPTYVFLIIKLLFKVGSQCNRKQLALVLLRAPTVWAVASATGFILALRVAQTACKRQLGSCFWLATDVPVWHEKVSYGTFTCNEPIMYPKILKHGLPALRLECMVLSRFVMYYRVFIRRLYANGYVSFRPKFWSTSS